MALPFAVFGFGVKRKFVGLAFVVLVLHVASAQDSVDPGVSRLTSERIANSGWWPTKGAASRAEYAGTAACAKCHADIVERQAQTPMFKAARRPEDASVLQQHQDLQFTEGDFSYAITRRNDQTVLVIQDKWGTLTAPVLWAIGNGEIGQTYLLKKDDTYYESRLSYFTASADLDVTPGHSSGLPTTLHEAVGMPQGDPTAQRCFGCHTTASKVSGVFDPEQAIPGIGCEACHGPSAKHVEAEEHENDKAPPPFNPRTLTPRDSVDFCGACHRTPADIAVEMPENPGILGIRFPAYRLERSLCWGASGDARITCIACHDPHQPLLKDTASYDSKCLQCHAATGHRANASQAAACTVASKNCASCHMPKYELKIAHTTLTDHFIQIVRPSSGYRD
jgi:hypothetical protein